MATARRGTARRNDPDGGAPGAPDDPLAQSLAAKTRTATRLYMRRLEEEIARAGISSGMWFFLRALWEEVGLSQTDLAERAGVMGPTTVTALNRMQRMGLIERRTSEQDRRRVHVFLTPRARALEAKLKPKAAALLELSVEGPSRAEVASLRRMLDVVIRNLQTKR